MWNICWCDNQKFIMRSRLQMEIAYIDLNALNTLYCRLDEESNNIMLLDEKLSKIGCVKV